MFIYYILYTYFWPTVYKEVVYFIEYEIDDLNLLIHEKAFYLVSRNLNTFLKDLLK